MDSAVNKHSQLVHRERCPACKKQGYDQSGDNLGFFSDGHKYCFRCHYFEPAPNTVETVKNKLSGTEQTKKADNCMSPPIDVTAQLPEIAINWLMKYQLTIPELNQFWWSEQEQQLIYPIFDLEGHLVIWQARNFDKNKAERRKYFSTGDIQNHIHILGTGWPTILVEDVISAIKVGREHQSIPLFGGYFQKKNLIRLKNHILAADAAVGIWLDPDKMKDAIRLKHAATELGLNAFIIQTKQDPKCYDTNQIRDMISHWRTHATS